MDTVPFWIVNSDGLFSCGNPRQTWGTSLARSSNWSDVTVFCSPPAAGWFVLTRWIPSILIREGTPSKERSKIYIHRNFARYMETIIAMQRLGAWMPASHSSPHTLRSICKQLAVLGVSRSPTSNINSSHITARINAMRDICLNGNSKRVQRRNRKWMCYNMSYSALNRMDSSF